MCNSGAGTLVRASTEPNCMIAGVARDTTVVEIAGVVRFSLADDDGLMVTCTCGKAAKQSDWPQLMETLTAGPPPAFE